MHRKTNQRCYVCQADMATTATKSVEWCCLIQPIGSYHWWLTDFTKEAWENPAIIKWQRKKASYISCSLQISYNEDIIKHPNSSLQFRLHICSNIKSTFYIKFHDEHISFMLCKKLKMYFGCNFAFSNMEHWIFKIWKYCLLWTPIFSFQYTGMHLFR